MTPNPKNIGAAPEGLTLEVGKTYITRDRQQLFTVLSIGNMEDGGEHVEAQRHNGNRCWFEPDGHFVGGHPEADSWDLVAEIPDAAGVPEPQAKGPSPSEVTQPGEGVDLEDAEKWFLGLQPMAKTSRTGLALIAEVRRLRSSNEGLVKALNMYGRHGAVGGPICEQSKHSEYPCTCGFEDVLGKAGD